MADVAALRKLADAAPTVTIDSKVLLELLDSVIVVTLNGVKKRAKRVPKEVDPEDERCAKWLFDVVLRTRPNFKKQNFAAWANDVRVMRECDERTHKEICALFLWAHKSSFWRGNILSPKSLREHWDRLCIQRDTAAEPKKTNAQWWLSDDTKLAKALEVGVGPAHNGESAASWEARIRAAIDNGGKPPAPQVFIRPAMQAPDATTSQDGTRTPKPAGFLKAALKEIQQKAAA